MIRKADKVVGEGCNIIRILLVHDQKEDCNSYNYKPKDKIV